MKIKELAKKLQIEYLGRDFEISAINTIKDAKPNEITFLDNERYLKELSQTKAGAIFIKEEFAKLLPKNCIALISKNPYLLMAEASIFFANSLLSEDGDEASIGKNCNIGKSVHIGKNSVIADGVTILDGAFIGDSVSIGAGSIIYPNASIYNNTIIGNECFIHAGAVIGCDGFGYAHTADGRHIKIYHNGNVILEERVEIGANSTIDRAVFGSTIIKSGTKIDNLVQVGHNCEMGENCIIVSQTGISGSSKLGRNVVMGGQSATAGHLEIGDFATVAARGGVTKSIRGGETYSGFPLMLHKEWLKLQAKISKLMKK